MGVRDFQSVKDGKQAERYRNATPDLKRKIKEKTKYNKKAKKREKVKKREKKKKNKINPSTFSS